MDVNTVTIKTFDTLSPEMNLKVKELKSRCFNHSRNTSEEHIAEGRDKFYNNKPVCHIVALENNKVISYLALLKRDILFNNQKIVMGGVGEICTLAEKRNKGIASLLIKEAMKLLVEMKCDIGYLCTEVDDPLKVHLYTKFGFQIYGKPHTYTGKSGKKYTDYDAMIAPINSPHIFKLVMNSNEPFDIGNGNW